MEVEVFNSAHSWRVVCDPLLLVVRIHLLWPPLHQPLVICICCLPVLIFLPSAVLSMLNLGIEVNQHESLLGWNWIFVALLLLLTSLIVYICSLGLYRHIRNLRWDRAPSHVQWLVFFASCFSCVSFLWTLIVALRWDRAFWSSGAVSVALVCVILLLPFSRCTTSRLHSFFLTEAVSIIMKGRITMSSDNELRHWSRATQWSR